MVLILVMVVTIISFVTNPSKDQFTLWLADKIEKQIASENPSELESKISDYLTNYLGKNLLDMATTHYNYKLFSIYKVKMLNEELTFIGFFNVFIKIK